MNDRKTIVDALRSIYAQTFTNWNMILLDDGSNDGTLDLVKQIRDDRVRVYCDGTNKQLSARLNEMNQMADGKYIIRLDADDLQHPERFAMQVEYMEKNPAVDLLGTGGIIINEHDEISRLTHCSPLNNKCHPFNTPFISASNIAKADWQKQHLFDGRYVRAEDQEFWTRLYMQQNTVFAKLNDPLYYVRKVGLGSLAKTRLSYKTLRRIAWEYGPPLIGTPKTLLGIAKMYAKESIHCVSDVLGFREFLWHHQADGHISHQQKTTAIEAITQIKNTPIPGWDFSLSKQVSKAA
jgi:glycosyltransferase involved in cell wall biosynthesis